MGIKYFQCFNIRCEHGNDASLLLAFQLGRTELSKYTENFVSQNGQQMKGNVMVAVLLNIAKQSAKNSASYCKSDDPFIRKPDRFPQCLGYAQCAEQCYAHGAKITDASVYDSQDQDCRKASQKTDQMGHNTDSTSSKCLFYLIHALTSAYPFSSSFCLR